VRVRETQAFPRQPIQLRGGNLRIGIEAFDVTPTEIVRQDHNDVWPVSYGSSSESQRHNE